MCTGEQRGWYILSARARNKKVCGVGGDREREGGRESMCVCGRQAEGERQRGGVCGRESEGGSETEVCVWGER